jgi:putative ABC transport system permease protein
VRTLLLFLAGLAVPAMVQAQVPGVAIESRLARALGLSPGDTLRLAAARADTGRRFIVAAIYQPAPDPATVLRVDHRVRLHLADLASLLGAPDRVDRFGVVLTPGHSADSVSALFNAMAFGFDAAPSREVAREASQTFEVVSRFHRAIALVTIVASGIFLLCIMLLKVEERRTDAAVMRLVGVRRRVIFGALLLEAAAVALAGSLLGTGLAWVAGGVVNAFYQHRFETQLVFSYVTPRIVILGVVLSLLLGLTAGAVAAWRLVRTPPLALWRRG